VPLGHHPHERALCNAAGRRRRCPAIGGHGNPANLVPPTLAGGTRLEMRYDQRPLGGIELLVQQIDQEIFGLAAVHSIDSLTPRCLTTRSRQRIASWIRHFTVPR
jgi:hypothetical protein